MLDKNKVMKKQLDLFSKSHSKWKNQLDKSVERKVDFETLSGEPLETCYFPKSPNEDYNEKLGFPGQFPFTRGVHANLYRGKLWTMRQFAGFGSPEETNNRFKQLLRKGQTGLSVAYDMPTLMGYDPDHLFSDGEVGKCGVSVFSLDEMKKLFKDISLSDISVSQTINGPAIILLAFYIAVAEEQGVDLKKIQGTLQNDILKEFLVRNTYIYPPKHSMKIVRDIFSYTSKKMKKFNSISISGYHIQEAGATADIELAYTLANGLEYVRNGIKSGMNIVGVDSPEKM